MERNRVSENHRGRRCFHDGYIGNIPRISKDYLGAETDIGNVIKKSSRRLDNGQLGILRGWTCASNLMERSRIHHLKLLAIQYEQETQGSFESVGTNDILIKSLGNAEHSGRIWGQSKFVKQSQYFNIVQSPKENAEVSGVKWELAALERTVQALCAKHDINQDTKAEETIAATIDQHNSFKASCTLNEKEAGASDPQPMPNASEENVRGIITVPKLKHALLPILTNEATCIEEVVSGFFAWLKRLVVLETSMSQASRGPSHAPDREVEGSKQIKKIAGKKKIQS
ncbi:hypothetical protein TIFTF001_020510 [Ficus carica]|uniref:Uncharacterized protein n=1 Tax=Ficus carica TaxID=3494 RepID=A0AA88AFW4_FICCA|nr:hypothetical protein TIFTF001_020510 [Ficus carica]